MTLTRTIKVDIVGREFRVEVDYEFYRGYAGSSIEPPEPPHVEISAVNLLDAKGQYIDTPAWLSDLIAESEYVTDELIEYATEA